MTEEKLVLRSADHPAARGRMPTSDELCWDMELPLEDGRTLVLEMGPEARAAFRRMLILEMRMEENDA